jgi:DNA-binding CsgD family transcriptional regulator
LISKGFRYEEIANTLNISYHTVTSHIKQIYRKLAVHSRSEAVFEATRLGIVR